MAQVVGDLSQNVMGNFTLAPQIATAAVAGTAVPTSTIVGDIYTLRFAIGAVTTFTTATCIAECSPDGTNWYAASGVGNTTPTITLTAGNTTGAVGFFPGNGTNSQYVRANVTTFTGTSANVTAMIEGQIRISTDAGYTNTPPSGST